MIALAVEGARDAADDRCSARSPRRGGRQTVLRRRRHTPSRSDEQERRQLMMPDTPRIVVGHDRSAHSAPAVRWAALEAAQRHAALEVWHVIDDGGRGARLPRGMGAWWWDVAVEQARPFLEPVVEGARRLAPSVPVSAHVVVGVPASELIVASRQADLLVLGTRSRRELAEFCFGSVVHRVAARAACPVVIAHAGDALPGPGRPVVVGTDASPASAAALDFAARTAVAAGAPLTVVAAWDTSAVDPWLVPYSGQGYPAPEDMLEWSRQPAEDARDRAVATVKGAYPGLDVRTDVRRGPAAQVLTGAAVGAGLLVVGTRGHNALGSLLLGSVSHSVIRSAPCPVVVVPPALAPDGAADGAPPAAVVEQPEAATTT
jgi:nucleotide-binding universal stress UspA family protein